MNQNRYFVPMASMPMSSAMMLKYGHGNFINRIFSGIKAFNWKGLISGANKTLNVFNQTIPLIKQAKPMISNVKSIMQLARAFNQETGSKKYTDKKVATDNNIKESTNYPTFFR